MCATVMDGAGDIRIETVPDARLVEPTDALVVVTRAAICGSDLWPSRSLAPSEAGRRMGHQFVGVVEAGDVIVAPFLYSDGTCVFCQEGLPSSRLHGGRYGWDGDDDRIDAADRLNYRRYATTIIDAINGPGARAAPL